MDKRAKLLPLFLLLTFLISEISRANGHEPVCLRPAALTFSQLRPLAAMERPGPLSVANIVQGIRRRYEATIRLIDLARDITGARLFDPSSMDISSVERRITEETRSSNRRSATGPAPRWKPRRKRRR